VEAQQFHGGDAGQAARGELELAKAERLAQIEANAKIAIAEATAKIQAQADIEIEVIRAGVQRETAQVNAQTTVKTASFAHGKEDPEDPAVIEKKQREEQSAAAKEQRDQAHLETMQALVHHLSRPKTIVRGPDGRATGVQ
jgi:flagellar basal body P-ring protein FlgI